MLSSTSLTSALLVVGPVLMSRSRASKHWAVQCSGLTWGVSSVCEQKTRPASAPEANRWNGIRVDQYIIHWQTCVE